MLIRWLLILLLVSLLFRALGRLVSGFLEGAGYSRAPQETGRGRQAVPLVRDPVCGTFVVPSRAVTLGTGATRQYFCSERCRDRYVSEARRA
jgi:YHS domain-containing protein